MNRKTHFPPRIDFVTFRAGPLIFALSLYLLLAACSGHSSTPGSFPAHCKSSLWPGATPGTKRQQPFDSISPL